MSKVDPEYLAQEWATDDEILQSMAEGGDLAHVVREINVQFVGELANLNKLKNDAKKLGFHSAIVEQDEDDEDGGWQIELQIDADTKQETIRELTRKCLEIEVDYDVDHDGWGCFARNENGPISDENPA